MNDNTTPTASGQQTDRTPSDPLTEILGEIRKLGDRIDAIEQRLGEEDEDDGPRAPPGLATRCDGRVLLSVAYVDGAKLEGRELWVGVVLEDNEAEEAWERLHDAGDEAASHIGGGIMRAERRATAP